MTVTIRQSVPADAPALHDIRSEVSARQFQPLRRLPLDQFTETLRHRTAQTLDASLSGKTQWTIEVDGVIAGWVTINVTSREHGVASIGYTIAEAHRGKGVATCAVRKVIDIAFDPGGLDLHRLEAVAAVANAASRRVLTKAGFQEEGLARGLLVIGGIRVDHLTFGLLRSDLSP